MKPFLYGAMGAAIAPASPVCVRAAQAGVNIIVGTDAAFLSSFNYPGISPVQALAAATRAGPAWFGKLDRHGAIASGKVASEQ
ncbi:amidohydrolase [Sphingomonas sp. KC8]|uniref:amidohydrolase n=1 Tax=Sphingomonas sp. KC8 TaxID=1030157 RepID=UPI0002489796|nr:amidohydrolase [Sphingomonas sp. KC8]ARS26579.1 amidohydrolase [Sphingomonas sp. KC8]